MSYIRKLIISAIALVICIAGVGVTNRVGCQTLRKAPTYMSGVGAESNVAFSRDGPDLNGYRYGDVVLYRVPGKLAAEIAVGRIVGMPGDQLYGDGVLHRNGELAPEKGTGGGGALTVVPVMIVPRDSVYILADERTRGGVSDSRSYGPINRFSLLGKAIGIE